MGERARERARGRWREWGEEGSFRFPLSISKIGLSLPRRCLFVLPHQGLKRERMQAARVERQEQADGERQRETEDGGGGRVSLHSDGTTCVAPSAGRLCGHTKRCWEEGRALGEPSVRRLSSVESRAGVCARGLPHTVPPSNIPTTASWWLLSLRMPPPPCLSSPCSSFTCRLCR